MKFLSSLRARRSSAEEPSEKPKMQYHILHRKWRLRKPYWYLFIFELSALVPTLVFFGISQPDLYRTKFWQIGFENGWNSNPNMVLYAHANYRTPPTVPFVWSQMLTNFNVAISVITLFFMLAKLIAFIMKVWYPIIATFVSVSLTALWAASVYGQMGPDYADDRYPSPIAWYIRMSCDVAEPYNAVKLCKIAKASFGVTVYMMVIQLAFLLLAIHSMLPNPENDAPEDDEDTDSIELIKARNTQFGGEPLRSPTTGVPYTPRTVAYRTLDRLG